MLYLIKDAYLNENDEPKKCLKIGYAKNIDDRMVGYGTSNNLNVILLATRDGGLGLEKLFHYYYKDKIIKLKGNREWMEYDEEIIAEFKKLTAKELFLNYYPDEKERSLKELIFDYFIGDNEESLNFILNCRKSREFFLIRDYLSSPIYFMKDIIDFIDQLQEVFSIILDDDPKKSFISEFQKKFNVKETLNIDEVKENDYLAKHEIFNKVNELKSVFNSNGSFESKMRILCNFLLNPDWNGHIHISDLYWLPLKIRNYLSLLGPKRIKELECRECEIIRELSGSTKIKKKKLTGSTQKKPKQKELISASQLPVLIECFSKQFTIGQRYSLKDAKEIISRIYNFNNITKTPKATDLEDYFNIRKCTINLKDGKRINGYEILSLKNP